MLRPEPELTRDVLRRRANLQVELARHRLDALVVASPANFEYFTGYRSPSWPNRARPLVAVLTPTGRCTTVLSQSEAERARAGGVDLETVPYLEPILPADGASAPDFISAAAAASLPLLEGARRLGLELGSHFGSTLPAAALAQLARDAGAEAVDASTVIWPLRMIKSEYEIACLRRSADALERTYDAFAAVARSGLSGRELHGRFLQAAAGSRADWIGYVNIVVGAHAPLVGGAGDRHWEPGELLLVDAGVLVDGYWSDFWRIFVNDEPTDQQVAAYTRLVEVLRAERGAIRDGVAPLDVVEAVRRRLPPGEGGFGRFGHGIGLDLTEPPSLQREDDTSLDAGMALCIEPAASYEGVGNLAAEETVVVTADGCDLISPPFPSMLQRVAG
jgi:Xaa-Pro aminopeptidase